MKPHQMYSLPKIMWIKNNRPEIFAKVRRILLMEGVTYEMMVNIEHLESFGKKPEKLFATGGGACSEVWLQIKADILNRQITSLAATKAMREDAARSIGFFSIPKSSEYEKYAGLTQANVDDIVKKVLETIKK